MSDLFWKPPYSFTDAVAVIARAQSRGYWARGGPADRAYPVAGDMDRIWPLSEPPEPKVEAVTRRGLAATR